MPSLIRQLRLTPIRIGLVAVWLGFGLLAKVLQGVPRHRLIVARVLGEEWAGPITGAVGVVEIGVALWILSDRAPRLCAAFQTALLVGMNTLELWKARDLLLSPPGMLAANVVLLSLAWHSALSSPRSRPPSAIPQEA